MVTTFDEPIFDEPVFEPDPVFEPEPEPRTTTRTCVEEPVYEEPVWEEPVIGKILYLSWMILLISWSV